MSDSQKGIFTVVGATALASALILFNGNNEAEADDKSASTDVTVNVQGGETKENPSQQEKVLATNVVNTKQAVLIPPPSGPFHLNIPSLSTTAAQVNPVNAIASGKTEQNIKAMAANQAPKFTKFKPSIPVAPELQAVSPKAPALKQIQQQSPDLVKPALQQPKKMNNTLRQPQMIPPPSAPVSGQQLVQPPVFNAKPPVQRYMYVPMPMYPYQPAPPQIYYNSQNFNNRMPNNFGNGNQQPKNEPIKSKVVQ